MKILFHLSTNCNLRCTYCYQHDKTSSVLPFEYAKELIDDLVLYRNKREGKVFKYFIVNDKLLEEPIRLDFFGGECTLHIELMDQICQYFEDACKENNFTDWLDYEIYPQTNGTTFLQPAVYKFFTKYGDRINTSLTVDGCKDCHNTCRKYPDGRGSYEDVEKAITTYYELFNKTPESKLTFSLDSMKYIKESIINLIKLKYKWAGSSLDVFTPINREQSNLYYEYLKETIDYIIDNKIDFKWELFRFDEWKVLPEISSMPTCGSMGQKIVINWDGNLYCCQQLSESFVGKEKELSIGHITTGITEQGLETLEELRHQNFRQIDVECMGCPYDKSCIWCPAINLKNTGHYFVSGRYTTCGGEIAEQRARKYFAKRAKETDYPYFKEWIDLIDLSPEFDPNRKYLMDREELNKKESN